MCFEQSCFTQSPLIEVYWRISESTCQRYLPVYSVYQRHGSRWIKSKDNNRRRRRRCCFLDWHVLIGTESRGIISKE